MNNIKYKNFIFDMGNVLINFDPYRIVSNYSRDANDVELLVKAIFKSPVWNEIDRGTYSEQDIYNYAKTLLPAYLHKTCDQILKNWYKYKINIEGAYEFVSLVKNSGFNLYLLSNVSLRFYEFKTDFPVLSLFENLVLSAEEKQIKPEKQIYQILLNRYNIKPEESIFIDDNQDNINTANSFGIYGIRFDGNYKSLQIKLTNEGIL